MMVRVTPLWPAGHLPLKGGDYSLRRSRTHFKAAAWQKLSGRLISPLEGEMAGRPEGGGMAMAERGEVLSCPA